MTRGRWRILGVVLTSCAPPVVATVLPPEPIAVTPLVASASTSATPATPAVATSASPTTGGAASADATEPPPGPVHAPRKGRMAKDTRAAAWRAELTAAFEIVSQATVGPFVFLQAEAREPAAGVRRGQTFLATDRGEVSYDWRQEAPDEHRFDGRVAAWSQSSLVDLHAAVRRPCVAFTDPELSWSIWIDGKSGPEPLGPEDDEASLYGLGIGIADVSPTIWETRPAVLVSYIYGGRMTAVWRGRHFESVAEEP